MNITLTPELESLVNRKVQSGRYNSAGEVIRDALQLMDEKDRTNEKQLEELRMEIIKAEDQIKNGQGALKFQVQYFWEKILHGKNIQTTEY